MISCVMRGICAAFAILLWLRSTSSHPLQSLAIFVGYPRSAHTIVGSILDAHPNIAVVHEGSIIEHAFSFRNQSALVDFIVRRAQQQHAEGRWQTGFSYRIDGAWQGQEKTPLLVMGDKKGGATTALLAADWDGTAAKFEYLRAIAGGHLQFIHVVRNVFDNIATMIVISEVDFNSTAYHQIRFDLTPRPWKEQYNFFVSRYLTLAATNARLSDAVLDMVNVSFKHVNGRQLLAEPFAVLRDLCDFLKVPFNQQWASAAAAKLFHEPFDSRNHFVWPQTVVQLVNTSLSMRPFADLMQLPNSIANDQ